MLDAVSGNLIVYGGGRNPEPFVFEALDDVWSLDPDTGAATQLTQIGSSLPAARFQASVADRSGEGYAVVFGGLPEGGPPALGDLWRMDYRSVPGSVVWTRLQPTGAGYPVDGMPEPRARMGAAASFTGEFGRMVIFGGATLPLAGAVLDDTWQWIDDQRGRCATPVSCSRQDDCTLPNCCCLDATQCLQRQLNTCVLPSPCDFANWTVGQACTVDANCQSATLSVCRGGRCSDPKFRARSCSWGLIEEGGAGKPAWDALLSATEPRVPLCVP